MRLLLLFLLVVSFAFSANSCIASATDIVLSGQGANIAIAFSLIIVVIASAYVAGSLLGNANYAVFAKDELYHLGFSVLLLIGFSGLVLSSCSISDFFFESSFQNLGTLSSGCYVQGAGLNSVSSCYLNTVKTQADSISQRYIKNYVNYLMDSTFAVSLQLPLLNSYTAVVSSYKRILSTQYDLIGNSFLVPAFMSLSLQKLALDFINVNVLQWLLPAAFLLRVIPPTRQMGNMLIAFSLGLYIIIPLMYVFNLALYDVVDKDCPQFAVAVCDPVVDGYSCSPASGAGACSNHDSFWFVAKLIPQAFFLPNLTVALLITFMSSVNKALKVIG